MLIQHRFYIDTDSRLEVFMKIFKICYLCFKVAVVADSTAMDAAVLNLVGRMAEVGKEVEDFSREVLEDVRL